METKNSAESSTESTTPFAVRANHLVKKFGDFVAVNDISFHVAAGECFGILGPNGAGKTTTIRMVYGFSPMTSGSLDVFGLDISTNWRRIKARVGVCQQENSLDPELTVLENLEVFALTGILLVTGVAAGHGHGHGGWGWGVGFFFAPPIIIAPAPAYPYPYYYYPPPPPPYGRPDYYGGREWVPGRWEEQWGPYGWERVWVPGYWR